MSRTNAIKVFNFNYMLYHFQSFCLTKFDLFHVKERVTMNQLKQKLNSLYKSLVVTHTKCIRSPFSSFGNVTWGRTRLLCVPSPHELYTENTYKHNQFPLIFDLGTKIFIVAEYQNLNISLVKILIRSVIHPKQWYKRVTYPLQNCGTVRVYSPFLDFCINNVGFLFLGSFQKIDLVGNVQILFNRFH